MASLATENPELFHSGNGQIELPSDDEIDSMPVTALRELITCARLTEFDCVEKPELRARAMRAVVKLRAERQAAMVALFQDLASTSVPTPAPSVSQALNEPPSDDEIASMTVTALRDLIKRARLTHADCVEKPELRARAMQAAVKLRGWQATAVPAKAFSESVVLDAIRELDLTKTTEAAATSSPNVRVFSTPTNPYLDETEGASFDIRAVQCADGVGVRIGTPSEKEIATDQCWGPCIWGDSEGVELMEYVLLLANHPLPKDLESIRRATPEEIAQGHDSLIFTRGVHFYPSAVTAEQSAFAFYSEAQFASIYHGIDCVLSAEDMNQLTAFPEFLQNLNEICRHQHKSHEEFPISWVQHMIALRWALLCFHVGADLPKALLAVAYECLDQEHGTWNGTPERKAFSAIAVKELGSYSAGLPLRFARETVIDAMSNGGTRFITNSFSRRRDVLHSCATCKITDSGTDDVGLFMKCSGCSMRYYCSIACQKVHWKTAHKHECAEMKKNGRSKTADDVIFMMTPNDKEEFAEILPFFVDVSEPQRLKQLKQLLVQKQNGKKHRKQPKK